MTALQFSLESYIGLPASTTMVSKPLQLRKAEPRIDVTEFGMVKPPVNPLQFSKAQLSIEVTEFGIVKVPEKTATTRESHITYLKD